MMDIQEKNEIIIQVIEDTLNSGFSNLRVINEFGYFKYYIKTEEQSDDGSNCKSNFNLYLTFLILRLFKDCYFCIQFQRLPSYL